MISNNKNAMLIKNISLPSNLKINLKPVRLLNELGANICW